MFEYLENLLQAHGKLSYWKKSGILPVVQEKLLQEKEFKRYTLHSSTMNNIYIVNIVILYIVILKT